MKSTPERYAVEVKENVEKHGFHITYVAADESPAFCYTTGIFKTHGIPELFVSSLPPGLAGDLMHSYVKRYGSTSPPQGCRITKESDPFDYYLIPVNNDDLREYVLATIKYYNELKYEYLQLVFPDPEFRFPHDDGYDYDQEILGDYTTTKMA